VIRRNVDQDASRLRSITTEQAKDTGMAMVLICLLVAHFAEWPAFYGVAVVLLLVDMIHPPVYRPAAVVWLGFSRGAGTVASLILLSVVFFLLVTPLGLIRRLMGHDPLQLRKWRQGSSSVFVSRDHVYGPGDLEHPY
jgi:hypothetical protein